MATCRHAADILGLRLVLLGVNPLIRRRLLVHADGLHYTLQIATGCEDVAPAPLPHPRSRLRPEPCRRVVLHRQRARGVRLGVLDLRRDERSVYEYGRGDLRVHEIRLGRVVPAEPRKRYPECTGGKRSAPPEDASLMRRKLGSYPRQNGLAVALRELGRIERSLFILKWLQDADLRRRVQAGLNKGEGRNGLPRAVFFNRLGEFRDRSFERQHYRASGLTLVTAAIVLWNTVYLARAVEHLRERGEVIDNALLGSLSPLGWDHINLTGDHVWSSKPLKAGEERALQGLVDR